MYTRSFAFRSLLMWSQIVIVDQHNLWWLSFMAMIVVLLCCRRWFCCRSSSEVISYAFRMYICSFCFARNIVERRASPVSKSFISHFPCCVNRLFSGILESCTSTHSHTHTQTKNATRINK